jgi:2-oxoglutarate dehydrogenase E2 component (dihydrolipoamide succinyltransferase)
MRVNVVMPQLGESVAEGTITKWLKNAGDKVVRDENILEISTDKVDSEIPATAGGILVEILAKEGETIPIGKPIAVIETEASQAKGASADEKKPAPPQGEKKPSGDGSQPGGEQEGEVAPQVPTVPYGTTESEIKIIKRVHDTRAVEASETGRFYTPLIKKMAEELGVSLKELDGIQGSGAGGRVAKKDLTDYVEKKRTTAPLHPASGPSPRPQTQAPAELQAQTAAQAAGVGEEIIPLPNMRKRIAEHMVRSVQTSPHVTSVSEADMSNIVHWREKHKQAFEERQGFKLTYTPLIIEATIRGLKEFPYINASLDGDNIIVKHYINFGVAAAVENGLVVPVIKGADGMNLLSLARTINDLSERARTKRITVDELQGSTFSMTNPGIFGNLFGTPIINQPNVAILGVGAIKKRPIVLDGDAIAVRPMVYISLTYDHRLIDGAMAGKFLQKVVHYLETFDLETTI